MHNIINSKRGPSRKHISLVIFIVKNGGNFRKRISFTKHSLFALPNVSLGETQKKEVSQDASHFFLVVLVLGT
jgi:hypothetical protein